MPLFRSCLLTLLAVMGLSPVAVGQVSPPFDSVHTRPAQTWPLVVAVGNHAVGLPGVRGLFRGPFPLGYVGTVFRLNRHLRHQWAVTADVGGYVHRGLQWALFVRPQATYTLRLGGWGLGAALGVGYLHHGTTTREYRFEAGTYRLAGQWGHPGALATAALQAGWGPRQGGWGLFLRYDVAFHLGFAPKVGIPVLPYQWSSVGAWVRLRSNER